MTVFENIERLENGHYLQHYKSRLFKSFEWPGAFGGGKCKLTFTNGRTTIFTAPCSVYNIQHGVPFSENHMKIFVGTWDKGLSCYDALSGEKIWHYRPSKHRGLFVYDDFIVSHRECEALVKLDIETGEILGNLTCSGAERAYEFYDNLFFVSRIKGSHCLFDADKFEVYRKYSDKIVNCNFPKWYNTITGVEFTNNSLIVKGFSSPSGNYDFRNDEEWSPTFTFVLDENVFSV